MYNTEFKEKYKSILRKALVFSEKAQREGLLSLEDVLEDLQEGSMFKIGLRMIVNGDDCRIVDKILTNMVSFETDNSEKILKNMQKEAVLSIQNKDPPYELMLLLSSLANFEIEDTKNIFDDVRGIFNLPIETMETTEDTYRISAEQVAEGITKFEDIVLLDKETFRLVLNDIEDVELGKALRNTYELRECIFCNISEERANNIKKIIGEIRWNEVEDAKDKIVKHIKNYFGTEQ